MKILVIHYSQSGQLTEILKNFVDPLKENTDIDFVKFDTKKKFPFPWTSDVFFDTMPESVLEEAIEIETINYKHSKYDLIILGYQPWFLSPSIPTVSLLKNDEFKKQLKDTKVITVIGSRNMWLNAQESIKTYLKESKADLIGNVPLFDRNNNYLSALSILHWMLTGKKTRKYGILPLPGVAQSEIDSMHQFGRILKDKLNKNQLNNLQEAFLSTNRINISNNLIFVELRAKKLFKIWANIIKKKNKSRKLWVSLYKFYLLFALFIIAPILLTILNIFVFPFTSSYFKEKKSYFCGIE